jgi:hypothetical protein
VPYLGLLPQSCTSTPFCSAPLAFLITHSCPDLRFGTLRNPQSCSVFIAGEPLHLCPAHDIPHETLHTHSLHSKTISSAFSTTLIFTPLLVRPELTSYHVIRHCTQQHPQHFDLLALRAAINTYQRIRLLKTYQHGTVSTTTLSCMKLLPPSSRVARRCPHSFRPFGGAEAEAPLG